MFESISPLEYRYLDIPESDNLRKYLSEEAFIAYLAQVEVALLRTYVHRGLCPQEILEKVQKAAQEITAKEVYDEEKKIHHQIRALVNCLVRKAGSEAGKWIHLGATSHDILCTADSLRYKDFVFQMLLPCLIDLENNLIHLALREKNTPQIGRTHGQHAVPITFGFALSSYVARLGNRILSIKKFADGLVGQFSGAVGAYNAQSILVDDPLSFEQEFLSILNLNIADHTTQIVPPEYLLDLLHGLISTFGVLANLSDDMRHLQRSEIDEIAEAFSSEQVGSSTMPHKRNPINFENVKSLYKTFAPRMMTYYLDQISEHQRDLSNSASSRFISEIFCALFLAARRLSKTMSKIVLNKESLQRNLQQNKDKILAEPYYLILARYGRPDAHEIVRRCVQNTEQGLMEIARTLPDLTDKEKHILQSPENYLGLSERKTEIVCQKWEKIMQELAIGKIF